jgi:hypothetical protein
MAKKDFKNLGALAVDKFFNTQDAPNTPSTHDTQHTPSTHDTQHTPSTHDTQHTPSTQHTLNAQVTPSTQHTLNAPNTPSTHDTQHTPQKRAQAKARINMAFEDEVLNYLQIISRLENVSITRYINDLVKRDAIERNKEITAAKKILK